MKSIESNGNQIQSDQIKLYSIKTESIKFFKMITITHNNLVCTFERIFSFENFNYQRNQQMSNNENFQIETLKKEFHLIFKSLKNIAK